jgi:hypothetical protein
MKRAVHQVGPDPCAAPLGLHSLALCSLPCLCSGRVRIRKCRNSGCHRRPSFRGWVLLYDLLPGSCLSRDAWRAASAAPLLLLGVQPPPHFLWPRRACSPRHHTGAFLTAPGSLSLPPPSPLLASHKLGTPGLQRPCRTPWSSGARGPLPKSPPRARSCSRRRLITKAGIDGDVGVGLLLCMFDRGASYLCVIQRWAVHKLLPQIANPLICRSKWFVEFADLLRMWPFWRFSICGPNLFLWLADL